MALLKLKKRHIHTVNLTVSSYSSYAQFLKSHVEMSTNSMGLLTTAAQLDSVIS